MKFQQLMTSVLKCQCETGWNKLRVWCRHCESHAALQRDCCWMLQMQFRRWGDRGLWELLRNSQKKEQQASQYQKGQRRCCLNVSAHLKAWAHSEGRATSTNQIPGTRTGKKKKRKAKIKLAIFYALNKLTPSLMTLFTEDKFGLRWLLSWCAA